MLEDIWSNNRNFNFAFVFSNAICKMQINIQRSKVIQT